MRREKEIEERKKPVMKRPQTQRGKERRKKEERKKKERTTQGAVNEDDQQLSSSTLYGTKTRRKKRP